MFHNEHLCNMAVSPKKNCGHFTGSKNNNEDSTNTSKSDLLSTGLQSTSPCFRSPAWGVGEIGSGYHENRHGGPSTAKVTPKMAKICSTSRSLWPKISAEELGDEDSTRDLAICKTPVKERSQMSRLQKEY